MITQAIKKKMLLITYGAALLFLVLRFDFVREMISDVIRVINPFLIGVIIAFILNRPMEIFKKLYTSGKKKRKYAKGFSILTVYILFFIIITAIVLFIIPQLITSIRSFVYNLDGYLKNLQKYAMELSRNYNLDLIDLNAVFTELNDLLKNLATSILNYIGGVLPKIVTVTSNILSVLFNSIIALVISINLLAGKEKLLCQAKKIVYAYLKPERANRIEYVVKLSSGIFEKYVVGQLTEACVLGILCFIGMSIFRFDYAMLISTLVGVTALIPVAGAWIGGGVAFVLLALTSPVKALLFLIFLIILQQLENNLIYPRIVGNSIGLPGLWVIFAVTVGGGIFGLPGIIFGVPVMAILYTLIGEDIEAKSKKQKEINQDSNEIKC